MRKLSVTIIAKNEADNLERCLTSVRFADEIVVLDSGSTDGSVEIARRFTERVVETDWPGHVKQKQRAVDAATHDWILSLDADEEVTPELAESIRAALADPNPPDAYELTRKVYYLGRWIEHCGWYPEWRVRLFDRRKAHWGGYDPHDQVICDGRVARLRGDLHHYSYRNMTHHLSRINEYTTIMADEYAKKGRRASLADMIFRPGFNFFKKYILQRGFLDGAPGFVICVLASYYVFLKYAKLWERQRSAS
ncbi:glycosyltransferase family 2 protein [bacterium]|nr:glycosyltransferase family 2 protein [bacterium]